MTTARLALYFVAALTVALLSAAYYYYQNLPAIVEQQARAYLQDYGVAHVHYDSLKITRDQLTTGSLQFSGEYQGMAYAADLSSLKLSFNWRSLLDGQIEALELDTLELSIVEQQPRPAATAPAAVEVSDFLPAPYLDSLPFETAKIRRWTLQYRSADAPLLEANGSLTVQEQLQLELAATYQASQVSASLWTSGQAILPQAKIQLGEDNADFFRLTARIDPAAVDSWKWEIQGWIDYAPTLRWLKHIDLSAKVQTDMSVLKDLTLVGSSEFEASLQHPEVLQLVDSDSRPLYSQLTALVKASNKIERLNYPGVIAELATEFDLSVEYSKGEYELDLGPMELHSKIWSQQLSLPETTRQWLLWEETVALQWHNPGTIRITLAQAQAGSISLKDNVLVLGNKESQLRVEELEIATTVTRQESVSLTGELGAKLSSRLRKEQLPAVRLVLSTAELAQDNTFHLAAQDLAESMKLDLRARANLQTEEGQYGLTLTSQDLAYVSSTVLPLLQKFALLGKRETVDITGGSLEFESELHSNSFAFDAIKSHSTLAFENLAGSYDGYSFEGLKFDADWTGLQRLQTKKPVELSLEKLNIGFDLHNTRLSLSLPKPTPFAQPAVRVDAFSSQLFGGRVFLPEPYQWDFAAPNNSFTIRAEDWRLAEMVALQQGQDIDARGILEGELPITISDGRIIIANGFLRALAPGGNIRYVANESSIALAQSSSEFALALDLLSDFQYEVLSSKVVLDEEGNLLLGLSLEGKNPALFDGRPVNFNINLEQNLDPLLQSLRLSDKLVEKLEDRIN